MDSVSPLTWLASLEDDSVEGTLVVDGLNLELDEIRATRAEVRAAPEIEVDGELLGEGDLGNEEDGMEEGAAESVLLFIKLRIISRGKSVSTHRSEPDVEPGEAGLGEAELGETEEVILPDEL